MSNVIDMFGALSPQQCFDITAAHLLKTRQKSTTSNGIGCTYAGFGCAAAPFLTEEARKTLHGTWTGLVKTEEVPPHNQELIQDLQYAHDRCLPAEFLPQWKERMLQVANTYGLDPHLILEDSQS